MNNLYREFLQESILITKLLDNFIASDAWEKDTGWDFSLIDRKIWSSEPLLTIIDKHFKIAHCVILKMNANVMYNWHTDWTRGLSINMLLGDSRSHCFFGFEKGDGYNDNFVELNYKPKKFYLFNTQHRHSVLNFDAPRYMFSVNFVKDKDSLTYNEVFEWCNTTGMFIHE